MAPNNLLAVPLPEATPLHSPNSPEIPAEARAQTEPSETEIHQSSVPPSAQAAAPQESSPSTPSTEEAPQESKQEESPLVTPLVADLSEDVLEEAKEEETSGSSSTGAEETEGVSAADPIGEEPSSTTGESVTSADAPARSETAEREIENLRQAALTALFSQSTPLFSVNETVGASSADSSPMIPAVPAQPPSSPTLFAESSETFVPFVSSGQEDDPSTPIDSAGFANALNFRFEENVGQFTESVDFVVRAGGYEAGFHAGGAVFVGAGTGAITMDLIGANPSAVGSGQNQLSGVTNYFVGNDTSQHFEGVRSFNEVLYQDVYAGIDARYYSTADQRLEYDFILAAGASPETIVLQFDGASTVELDAEGNLRLATANGEFFQDKPFTYQDIAGEQREVASRFVLLGENRVSFEVGAYDESRELTIDPKWGYSSYIGGTGDDTVGDVAVDSGVNPPVFLTGSTTSSEFRPGANKIAPGGGGPTAGSDAFVAKLRGDGKQLDYLTFLGGNKEESSYGIALHGGAAYITGNTASPNFIAVGNNPNHQHGGGNDLFVAKLDAAGKLVYTALVGGTKLDSGNDIVVDAQGNVYVTGISNSIQFIGFQNPQTIGPTGSTDMLLARLDSTGATTNVVLVGGTKIDTGSALAMDNADQIYITGYTQSDGNAMQSFPTNQNAFRTTYVGGASDAFVMRLEAKQVGQNTTIELKASTFFGSQEYDSASDLVVDPATYELYVVGDTKELSTKGFLSTLNVKMIPLLLGAETADQNEAWAVKFDMHLSPVDDQNKPHYFVYIAGKEVDSADSVALVIDAQGGRKLYVGGTTASDVNRDQFPVKASLQPFRGHGEAFVAYLDPTKKDASTLLYNTYLGGSSDEWLQALGVDQDGNVYAVGKTSSINFRPPGMVASFQDTYAKGHSDGFVVKILPDPVGNNNPGMNPLPPNQGGVEGGNIIIYCPGSDPDGEPIICYGPGAPPGSTLTKNGPDWVFQWTPSAGAAGIYTFAIQMADPDFRFDEQFITIEVAESGNPDLAGDTLSEGALVDHAPSVETLLGTYTNIGDGAQGTADVDIYQVTAESGQIIRADVDALMLDDGTSLSSLDSTLRLFDANGVELAFGFDGIDPDTGLFGSDAVLEHQVLQGGDYFIALSGDGNDFYDPQSIGSDRVSGSTGAYQLQLSVSEPPLSPDGLEVVIDPDPPPPGP